MSDPVRLKFLALAACLTACLETLQLADAAEAGMPRVAWGGKTYDLYPATFKERPGIPSPCRTEDGREVLTTRTERNEYALIPVTITPGITVRPWEAPLEIDREDFPALAMTGRHAETELDRTRSITGRSLTEITELGRPGRLSSSGFMAEDEDILSVLKGDNRLVTQLGLTHAELARPLLHVCNLIRGLYRETGALHTNLLFYNGRTLPLEIGFSRGGQKSIFRLPSCLASSPSRKLRPRLLSRCTRC